MVRYGIMRIRYVFIRNVFDAIASVLRESAPLSLVRLWPVRIILDSADGFYLFIYLFLIVVQRRRRHRWFCSSFGCPSVLHRDRCASPSPSRATPKRLRDRTRFSSLPFVPFVLSVPHDDLCRLCRRR